MTRWYWTSWLFQFTNGIKTSSTHGRYHTNVYMSRVISCTPLVWISHKSHVWCGIRLLILLSLPLSHIPEWTEVCHVTLILNVDTIIFANSKLVIIGHFCPKPGICCNIEWRVSRRNGSGTTSIQSLSIGKDIPVPASCSNREMLGRTSSGPGDRPQYHRKSMIATRKGSNGYTPGVPFVIQNPKHLGEAVSLSKIWLLHQQRRSPRASYMHKATNLTQGLQPESIVRNTPVWGD